MRPRRLAVALPFVVLAASQVGHLLAWELRQGPRALAVGGSGAHAYVPALTAVALGAAGTLALSALLLVAGARAARSGRGRTAHRRRRPKAVGALDLAAALFALQLAIFLVQEVLESAVVGRALPSAGDLLLWGSLGQLPVSLVAAVVLRSLGSRLEAAVQDLAAAAGRPLAPRRAAPSAQVWVPAGPLLRPSRAAAALCQRGPPALLRPV